MKELVNIVNDLKTSDLISYNFLFSNEKQKFAIVLSIKEDLNFGFMIEVLNEDGKISFPAGVIEYRKI